MRIFFITYSMILSMSFFMLVSCCSPGETPKDTCTKIEQKNETTEKPSVPVPAVQPVQRGNELLVKFHDQVTKQEIEKIALDLNLEIVREVVTPNLYLLKIQGEETVDDMMEKLRLFKEVEYSEPNYVRKKVQ